MVAKKRMAFDIIGIAFRKTIPTMERANTVKPVMSADIPTQSGMTLPVTARSPNIETIQTTPGPNADSPSLNQDFAGVRL